MKKSGHIEESICKIERVYVSEDSMVEGVKVLSEKPGFEENILDDGVGL